MLQAEDNALGTTDRRMISVKNFWNGMFDFNGDGITDIGEEFIAFKIFEAVTEESEDDEDDENDGDNER